jgi:hypothetical protein
MAPTGSREQGVLLTQASRQQVEFGQRELRAPARAYLPFAADQGRGAR